MSHRLKQTASQTAGPYLHIGLTPSAAGLNMQGGTLGQDIAGPQAKGARIRVEGFIHDGAGDPVTDAMLEVWQANADGHYAGSGDVEDRFRGWGRAVTDFETGIWGFETIKPGATPGQGGVVQAPHLHLWIVARGINMGLHTRMYFDDETAANAADPVLNMIPGANARETLIATGSMRDGIPVYRFDIRLQGADETVFFDI